MVKMPFEHPLKTRLLQLMEEMDVNMEAGLPEWMGGYVSLGQLGGEDVTLRLRNLNPLSGFGEAMPLFNTINPAIKLVVERQLGLDTYTGQPFFTPEDVIQSWNGDYWQVQRDGNGNIVGVEPTTKPLPDILKHVGSQFPQLSFFGMFERYPKALELQIASYVGAPLSGVSVDEQRTKMAEAQSAALQTAINRDEEVSTGIWS
jgi:hypothetical protein